ncbi:MAG: ABC transporter ATP-binding protein [Armatimonadetes bacterium]|nr:ABC transporter ATP-binding protein [Armatimonadota bacterium]
MMAIRITNLRYIYPDGQIALRGVSLSVREGETLGLLGPNGAGKSTLLLHLNGLLRGQGEVEVLGQLLTPVTIPLLRQQVGFVFQDPDDQLFMPTVGEDVAFGPRNQGVAPAEVDARVEAALQVVGLAEQRHRPPHHLSLGQKKRAALATVLAMDCRVLVLDEPTSGLDPRGRRELVQFLMHLPQTKVVATHDLEFAVEVCDRVVVLSDGQVVAEGPPRIVLANEALMERTGLAVPHSLRFHEAGVPHRHWAGSSPPLTEEQ